LGSSTIVVDDGRWNEGTEVVAVSRGSMRAGCLRRRSWDRAEISNYLRLPLCDADEADSM